MPISLSRTHKKIIFFFADAFILVSALTISFFLRFEGSIPTEYSDIMVRLTALSLAISLPIYFWQGLYSISLSYIGVIELYQIIRAVGLATLCIIAVVFLFRESSFLSGLPRSILFLNAFLTLLGVSAVRISKRFISELRQNRSSGEHTIIVGAGETGEELSRTLQKHPRFKLLGFIDDDRGKHGISIHGYKILGSIDHIPKLALTYEIKHAVIALPSADRRLIQKIYTACNEGNIKNVKIIPSHGEVIDEHVSITHLRDITIEDLLGRAPIHIDAHVIKKSLEGKTILVTGAAGSIGSRLCKEILTFSPKHLIALDQNETGIFFLEQEILSSERSFTKPMHPFLTFIIGDICNERTVSSVFSSHPIDIVFHAAAYKHVPLMEQNPFEGVRNNIFGTYLVAHAAAQSETLSTFIFISTDKAIHPTSIMGATKYIGELICKSFNSTEKCFCSVRFGNVLDSQGNVIEVFQKNIKQGKPLTITHPEMKRYFMVTSEACLLVMEAGAITHGGEVFILDMGEPIKINDLAREMIRLAGLEPDVDIPIITSGIRPGEKLFEELLTHDEIPTQYKKLFITKTAPPLTHEHLKEQLITLKKFLDSHDTDGLVTNLFGFIKNIQHQTSLTPYGTHSLNPNRIR